MLYFTPLRFLIVLRKLKKDPGLLVSLFFTHKKKKLLDLHLYDFQILTPNSIKEMLDF